MDCRLKEAKFYGIVDLGYVLPEKVDAVCLELIDGGADVVQLRAKGFDKAVITELGKRLLRVCERGRVPFIVNDFPDVAQVIGADGVHIGQDDGSLELVREIVGGDMLVGRSTHGVDQAVEAYKEGFDYIGFGPLFETPTKKGRLGIGLENVREVYARVGSEIPVFCIGGLKRSNLLEVVDMGVERAVIVSDVLTSDSISERVREIKMILD